MGPLGYLSIGFAPGVLWLWLIVRRSQHRPEPRSLLLRTFLLGVAVALPIVFVESLMKGAGGASGTNMSPADAAFTAFLVAGLCEELGKFWVVQASLKNSPYLDDPLRGHSLHTWTRRLLCLLGCCAWLDAAASTLESENPAAGNPWCNRVPRPLRLLPFRG